MPTGAVEQITYLFVSAALLPRKHGFGSTEFHVIRPHEGRADARYLLHYLRLGRTLATRIRAVEALKATHRAALAELDSLFASLQQQDFSGQLWAYPIRYN